MVLFNIDLNKNKELIYTIINNISKLHIQHYYKNKDELPLYLKEVKTIKEYDYYNILIKDRYDKFIIDNSFIKVFDNIKDNFHKINDELSSYPLSLCHGDLKNPNIF